MSDFEGWRKKLNEVLASRKEYYEDLLRLEGQAKAWSKSTNSIDRNLAPVVRWLAKETRTRESEDMAILDFVLTLFDRQAKDIDALKRAVATLAVGDSTLNNELIKIKSWAEKREEILAEIEQMVQKRRKFFDENR